MASLISSWAPPLTGAHLFLGRLGWGVERGARAESLGEAGLPGHRRPSSWDPWRGWWEKPPPAAPCLSVSWFLSPLCLLITLSVCLSPRLALSLLPSPLTLSLCPVPLSSWSTPSDRYGPPTGPLAPMQGTP